MIGIAVDALRNPAEIGCLAIGVGVVIARLLGLRWRWSSAVGVLAILLFGTRAAVFRETRAVDGVRVLPWDEWAGLAAQYHAWAARIGWLAATVAAVVLLTDTRAPSIDRRIPGGWLLVGVAALFTVAAVSAPEVGWVVLVVLGIAAVSRGASTPDPRIGFAAVLAGVAAVAGAEAHLYRVATLIAPGDVGSLDGAALARIGAWVGAGVATAWGVWRIGPAAPLGAVVGVAGLVAVDVAAARQGLARGPVDGLDAVRPVLSEWIPSAAARIPGGCLVTRTGVGWEGRDLGGPREARDLLARRGLPGCPSEVGPGTFGPLGVPILAVSGDTPTEALIGWHGSPVGAVVVLVRLDGGRALPAWRISGVPFDVWEAPGTTSAGETAPLDPRGIPLPGSVLLKGTAPLDQQLDRVRRVSGPFARVDLLIHPTAAPTVADLLAVCRGAQRVHPSGLRCVIAAGDPTVWARVLGDHHSTGVIDPNAAFEVIETYDEIPVD